MLSFAGRFSHVLNVRARFAKFDFLSLCSGFMKFLRFRDVDRFWVRVVISHEKAAFGLLTADRSLFRRRVLHLLAMLHLFSFAEEMQSEPSDASARQQRQILVLRE